MTGFCLDTAPKKDYNERNESKKEKGIIMMKSTGMVRKIDELGRIVMPAEIRQTLGLEVRDAMEIFIDGERVILQKYQPSCIFCTNADNLIDFGGKRICPECLAKLKKLN